jgi:hypothetical protein
MSTLKEIWVKAKGKTITLVVGCYFSFVALFIALNYYASGLSDKIDRGWETTLVIETEGEKTFVCDSKKHYRIEVDRDITKSRSFSRIIAYLNEVKRRYNKHDRTMIFFYEQYFLFNMMQAIMIMATTIIGLVVSKFGWDKINKDVLYVFFIIAGFMAFVKMVPEFLKVEDNIKSNKKNVVIYSNMEQSIISYLSTGENAKGIEINPVRYVHLLDKEMNSHNNIAFDLEKIPDQDFDFGKKD